MNWKNLIPVVFILLITATFSAWADNPILVGYNRGFFIQNEDGSFIFKLNGRIQPRLEYTRNLTDNSASEAWTFKLRKASLNFNTTIAKKLSFFFILSHSTKSYTYQTMNIELANVAYQFCPEFKIGAGMGGLPLSIIGPRSSATLLLLEKPLTQSQRDKEQLTPLRSSFGNPFGLGIHFSGVINKFFYFTSVVNGASATDLTAHTGGGESDYDLNFNNKASVGTQVGYNIFDPAGSSETDFPNSDKPKWTVAAGANYQGRRQDPYTATIISRILTGSMGSSFKWRGFALNSEIYGRKMTISDPGNAVWFSDTMDDFGYYVDSGYFIISNKLELAAVVSQIFREGPHNNSYQVGGGANWYIKENNLKLQLAYTLSENYNDITDTQTRKDHFLGLMFSAGF